MNLRLLLFCILVSIFLIIIGGYIYAKNVKPTILKSTLYIWDKSFCFVNSMYDPRKKQKYIQIMGNEKRFDYDIFQNTREFVEI